MPKKRKTLAEKRQEVILKSKEKTLESLCRKCGLCCHIKIGLTDGSYVIHPIITCKYLTDNNLCSVYKQRHLYDAKLCFTREEMISRDYQLPEGCPYVSLRQGYKPARVVTQAEFEDILVQELERGNYNILLAERVF